MRCRPLLLLPLLFLSCEPETPSTGPAEFLAWTPVYAQPAGMENISFETVRPTQKPGKIYAWGKYIFQNEMNEGIHIIDNANPAQPQKIAFIKIPFSTEFAVKGSYIYANNVSDLVVIDMQDPLHPNLVKRVKDAFPVISQHYPPQQGLFVCPDAGKGVVVGWELKNVKEANCRR